MHDLPAGSFDRQVLADFHSNIGNWPDKIIISTAMPRGHPFVSDPVELIFNSCREHDQIQFAGSKESNVALNTCSVSGLCSSTALQLRSSAALQLCIGCGQVSAWKLGWDAWALPQHLHCLLLEI